MNDVLPKPFTKEGLLNMLEKHLAHLKKMPDTLDMVPNTASTIAHNSNAHSIKDEGSQGNSPSTISNWNSPNQFTGISPTSSAHYMPSVNAAAYGIDQGQMQYQQPTTPIGGPPRGVGHRRQASDMSPVDDIGSDSKRPRIYATTNAAVHQMRRGPPG